MFREAAAATFAFFLLISTAASETIRMAWFELPPHVFANPDGKSPSGPTIDLFEQIAARMGCDVEWVGPIPIARLGEIQSQPTGDIDGTFLHIKSPKMASFLLFPREPYYIAQPCFGVLSSNPLKAVTSIEDIRGWRIGFVKTLAISYPPFMQNNLDKVVIERISGDNWTSRNLSKLLMGRLDALYERNMHTLSYFINRDQLSAKIRILPVPDFYIPHYFVFHRNSPRAAALLIRYEKAVAGWHYDYEALLEREIANRK